MKKTVMAVLVLAALCWALPAGAWQVAGEKKVSGLGHPESVAHDPAGGYLYVSLFGPELKPLQKDGKGSIARLDLTGKVLDARCLPPAGGVLHKPKGLFVAGGRLWTTDIDSAWIFDLATKKGRRAALPGAVFANDPVVIGDRLYVSDMAAHKVYLVEPADFLAAEPKVSVVVDQPGLAPNGLAKARDGALLIGSASRDPQGGELFKLDGAKAAPISKKLGSIDGLAVLDDGAILYTDWMGGGLFVLEQSGEPRKLAGGFQGPADFGLVKSGGGLVVVVPDLVTGDIRFITLKP